MATLINVDSTIHEERVVDAKTAARLLGVKLPTLYAYASRGLIKSVGRARSRGHRYLLADVTRLRDRAAARRGHGAVAAGALRWGEPVLDSAITRIDPGGPSYRGLAAVDLATRELPFEQVAELLIAGSLPARPPSWRAARITAAAAARARPLSRLIGCLSAVAQREPFAEEGPATAAQRARALILHISRHMGPRTVAARASVAGTLASSLGLAATPARLRALNVALVLLADHELNVGSFAARVVASSGAGLAASLLAGALALTGPKHGSASDEVEAWLARVSTPAAARALATREQAKGRLLAGFHHTLYPRGDPRAAPLLALAEAMAPRSLKLRTLRSAAQAMIRRGWFPNVDFGLVALRVALGARRGSAAAIFAVGRAGGWSAHALEQRAADVLLRPRARYVGR